MEYLVTDIGGGADIYMESAFLYRAATVVDKRLSVNRRRNSRDYDWRFMYILKEKADLSQA